MGNAVKSHFWLLKVAPPVREELEELKKAFKAGEIALSKAAIYRTVKSELPELPVRITAFKEWLGAD